MGSAHATAPATRPAPQLGHGAASAETAAWALARAAEIFAAPLPELIGQLGPLLGELLPARRPPLLAVLTGDCSHAPLKVGGDDARVGRVTSSELAALAPRATPGRPWIGEGRLGGAELRLLVISALPAGASGSVFAIELAGTDDPAPAALPLLTGLCELAALTWIDRAVMADPGPIVSSIAASQERTRTVAELGDAHEATLTAVLAALRAPGTSDEVARASATDVAVTALIALREHGDRERSLSEEPVDRAFERLREQLAPIARHAAARLEFVVPELPAGPLGAPVLPAELAHAARATSRGAVLALLDQEGVGRIRLAWSLTTSGLEIHVRDDGPGELPAGAFAGHRISERLEALGGRITVEPVPGWGTTIVAGLPLRVAPPAPASPLAALGERELEVLTQLAAGARNREIAERLTITPHTVKFHVGNILRKLGVATRGEAAALAHEHGLGR